MLYEKIYVTNSTENKTFQFDDALPSLPLPTLEQTLKRYLLSVKPFLSNEEFERTKKLTKDFENGIGKELQQRLKLYAKDKQNWVTDWWLKYAYLSNRSPLLPSCNMVGAETTNLDLWPPSEEKAVEYACRTLFYALTFFELIHKEKLRPHFSKNGEKFSMDQFRNFFCTDRVPKEGVDEVNYYFKSESEGDCPKHIVVFYKKHIWYLYPWDSKGDLLPNAEIEYQLKYLIQMSSTEVPGPGIGILTFDDRDTWAKTRNWLVSLSDRNQSNLKLIESSILALSLIDTSPASFTDFCDSLFHFDGFNRWADKSYSTYVTKNGYVGGACDHTSCDAMISTIFAHYAHLRQEEEGDIRWQPIDQLTKGSLPYKLEFDIDSIISESIISAHSSFSENGKEVSGIFENFTDFGKEWIKEHDLHPDSFLQCLLLLAYFKMHRRLAPIYETATTRRFYRGRTETIRSCTLEVADWIHAMDRDDVSVTEKKKKLKIACQRHTELMNECQTGNGIDRHLMGLYLIAHEANLPIPEFFNDEAFYKSGGGGNFVLSTSLIGYTANLGGVAAMTKDGYGVFYTLLPDRLLFFITNYRNGETCLPGYVSSITSSLQRVKEIFTSPISKF